MRVGPLLTAQQHEVSPKPFRVPALGIEIDARMVSVNGVIYWAEFKGSWQGKIPGLRRTDTVKKALANAFLVATAPDEYPPGDHIDVTSARRRQLRRPNAGGGCCCGGSRGSIQYQRPRRRGSPLSVIATDHYPRKNRLKLKLKPKKLLVEHVLCPKYTVCPHIYGYSGGANPLGNCNVPLPFKKPRL